MKRKIVYLTLTAVIGATAFFVGKNFTEQFTQPEIITPQSQEITDLTVTEYGLMVTFSESGFFLVPGGSTLSSFLES